MDVLNDWLITFGRLFFSPSSQTVLEEAQKAKGKFPSAVAWLAFSIVVVLIGANYVSADGLNPYGAMAAIILLPIVVLFFVFCLHLLYLRLFNRKKNLYAELLYVVVGIFVPTMVLFSLVEVIEQLGDYLSIALFLYSVILIVVAVQAITKLKVWQTLVIVLLSMILGAIGLLCIPTFLLSFINSVPRII